MIKTLEIGWDGVQVEIDGEIKTIAWESLRAASTQDDAALRAAYSRLYDRACEIARHKRAIRVITRNQSGHSMDAATFTWAAELRYMSGEFATGRLVAADFGTTGCKRLAEADAAVAVAALKDRGYEVRQDL